MKRYPVLHIAACITLVISCMAMLWRPLSGSAQEQEQEPVNSGSAAAGSYEKYLSYYSSAASPQAEVVITPEQCEKLIKGQSGFEADDVTGAVLINEGGSSRYRFSVSESGLYNIKLNYYPIEGTTANIELSLLINGKSPYLQAKSLVLSKVWKAEGLPQKDSIGNELQPLQQQAPEWIDTYFMDTTHYAARSLQFYFEKGENELTLNVIRESVAVSAIKLCQPKKTVSYSRYRAANSGEGEKDFNYIRQAEEYYRVSHAMIYATEHRGTPSVEPSDPALIRLNTIGQSNWDLAGQWISWEVEVPRAGYYRLCFKYRQNEIRGFPVVRSIYIDGKLPFEEASLIEFPYTSGQKWKNLVPSDAEENPYEFYFESAGTHIIRLDVAMGEMGALLDASAECVTALNDVYRKIIAVTGTSPDAFRDYYLDKEIPGLTDSLREQTEKLSRIKAGFDELAGGDKGNQAAFIQDIVRQINSFIAKPNTIQRRLTQFQNNISSLADVLFALRSQPLYLDSFTVCGADYEPPSPNASLWSAAVFSFKGFISSFRMDYNSVGISGDNQKDPVTVWVSTNDLGTTGYSSGRDQLMAIKRLVDKDFSKEHDIPIELRLVDSANTLTHAILAGEGPDVALIVPTYTPMNLAIRGALVELSQFDGFEKISKEFFDSALIPYQWEGGTYALPEAQTFMMQFYRTDIFDQYGLTCPVTWEEFYDVTSRLTKKNLQVGVPENQLIFETILMQNGGSVYAADEKSTALDTNAAVSAFEEWTKLYSDYSVPLYFDSYSRFRSGEMPLLFMSYTFYSMLTVAAPEITGLWAMAPMPGRMLNGEFTNVSSSNGTGAIMLKDAKNQQNCFEFMSWWVGAQAQAQFGNEIESQMGPIARYNTANKEAFRNMPWSSAEQELIMSQWKSASATPNPPGCYYISRSLTNAFRNVVMNNKNPREMLNRYNTQMNNEIKRKRNALDLEA